MKGKLGPSGRSASSKRRLAPTPEAPALKALASDHRLSLAGGGADPALAPALGCGVLVGDPVAAPRRSRAHPASGTGVGGVRLSGDYCACSSQRVVHPRHSAVDSKSTGVAWAPCRTPGSPTGLGQHAPQNAMSDPCEIARFHDRCSDLMRELLRVLADAPDTARTFPEIEDAMGWPRRRISSVLGGASHLRHTEFGGRRHTAFTTSINRHPAGGRCGWMPCRRRPCGGATRLGPPGALA